MRGQSPVDLPLAVYPRRIRHQGSFYTHPQRKLGFAKIIIEMPLRNITIFSLVDDPSPHATFRRPVHETVHVWVPLYGAKHLMVVWFIFSIRGYSATYRVMTSYSEANRNPYWYLFFFANPYS